MNDGEYNRFLAKIIIQLISPKIDFTDPYWYCVHANNDFSTFVQLAFEKKFPWGYIRDTIDRFYEANEYYYLMTYADLVEVFPCEVMSDSNELEIACDTVLRENSKSVADYKKGKTNSINHLKGQVMKLTKGKADVNMVSEILERKLKG